MESSAIAFTEMRSRRLLQEPSNVETFLGRNVSSRIPSSGRRRVLLARPLSFPSACAALLRMREDEGKGVRVLRRGREIFCRFGVTLP